MRYKEFVTVENIDKFMSSILGTSSGLGSFTMPSDSSSDTDSKTDVDTKADTKTSSGDEMLPVNAPISSPFGRRASGMHLGTDFAVPIGTPVRAPQDGVILKTGSDNMNGIFVQIDSNGTIHSLLHLSKSKVTTGQQVQKGQVVGLSGNTGHSTGPHLHWSKRIAGRPVDPMSNVE